MFHVISVGSDMKIRHGGGSRLYSAGRGVGFAPRHPTPPGVERSGGYPVSRLSGVGDLALARLGLGCSGFSEESRSGLHEAVTPTPPAPVWSVKGDAPGVLR